MAMNIIAKDKKIIKWLGIPECYKQQTNNNNNIEQDIKQVDSEIDATRQALLKQIEQEEVNFFFDIIHV